MSSEDEKIVPVDVKSRIAAFSQVASGSNDARYSGKGAATSPILPPAKPPKPLDVQKTPTTSQLLPAWQQSQQELDQSIKDDNNSNTLLKPSLLSSRPRASTNDSPMSPSAGDAGSPSKLGVKSIIALYGQQGASSLDSSIATKPRGSISSADGSRNDLSGSNSPQLFSSENKAPPPVLPPRPRMGTSVSQSNTGSSNHSTASTGNSITLTPQIIKSEGINSQSAYVPYNRKGISTGSPSPAGSGAESNKGNAPALPPRSSLAARSIDDLSLTNNEANKGDAGAIRRQLGSGPKWASSSSSPISLGSDNSMTPPAVPPRVMPSSTPSGAHTLVPPPKRGITSVAVPASPKINRNLRPSSASIPIRDMSNNSPSSNGKSSYAHRSSTLNTSALTAPISSASSSSIAPPPRHVDVRRMGMTNNASQSTIARRVKKEQRRVRRDQRQQRKMTLQYSRDPGDAEERYSSLFDRQLTIQQQKMNEDHSDKHEALLNKKAVVRIWSRSRLEDWYLARVWDAASDAEGNGVNKVAFVRAMSAIDYELARRRNSIKESQTQ